MAETSISQTPLKKPQIKVSKISNLEWGLIIGTLLFIDIVEFLLGLFAIGEIVNTLIDFFVGPGLYFYLYLRGEDLKSSRRLVSFVGTFFLELLPFVNDLPLWTLDGIYLFILSRAQNATAKTQQSQYSEKSKQMAAYEKRLRIEALKRRNAELQQEQQDQEDIKEQEIEEALISDGV